MSQPAAYALRPLWSLATGVVAGAIWAHSCQPPEPWWSWLLLILALTAMAIAVVGRTSARPDRQKAFVVWFLAGLALAGGRALPVRAEHLARAKRMTVNSPVALRLRATIRSGWVARRWGWESLVRIQSATHRDQALALPSPCRLEVRGQTKPQDLPRPGSLVACLVSLRGSPDRPLLVASSPTLLRVEQPPRGLDRQREKLVRALLDAAGTNARRIRTAELAAALALGRRDLVPAGRREGWRRSGLAHLLAVSGLHVGLVGATVWMLAIILRARPKTARLLVFFALPAYAVLAGASPSALRAALMGMVFFGARLLGRAILAMAAVLLAAVALLLFDPSLVVAPGFQLTVLITAALVRWVPPLAEWLPGPRWLSAVVAVPLVAQIAAAPLVAWHFRSAIPGGLAANLAAPPLLAPTLLLALGATAAAPVLAGLARLALDCLSLCEGALWFCGAPARSLELVVPTLPVAIVVLLVIAGWVALASGRQARWGGLAWLVLIAGTAGWWLVRPGPPAGRVTLAPVGDGLAAVIAAPEGAVLVDGGRYRREISELLADIGVRRLTAVIASHCDSDHLGGLGQVIASFPVQRLVMPAWTSSDPAVVPLLRQARRRGVQVVPVARGTAIKIGGADLAVVWPPARGAPPTANERSLVALVDLPQGKVLLTSDVGRATEIRLAAISHLDCDVLIAGHHGSKFSTTPELLAATRPQVVLIPAGPRNTNGHPHREMLDRLRTRHLRYRYPARDGWCGAEPTPAGWQPFGPGYAGSN